MEDGDLISIPALKQTVKVSGEVLYPVRIPYSKMRNFKSYVNGAGGYTQRAYRSRAYVVYANGSAKGSTNFVLFNVHPRIKAGAEIIVPTRQERKRVNAIEIASISASVTTLAVLVISLFKK
jgi:protein involved in polysaccharide export with SLBB domain